MSGAPYRYLAQRGDTGAEADDASQFRRSCHQTLTALRAAVMLRAAESCDDTILKHVVHAYHHNNFLVNKSAVDAVSDIMDMH